MFDPDPSVCDHCGNPTVWSYDRQQRWCSAFGTHPEIRRPSPLILQACDETRQALRARRRTATA